MEGCLRDDYSRECISLPLELHQAFNGLLVTETALLVGLFIFYIYMSRHGQRPWTRRLSFALLTLGLLLGVPKFAWHAANPELLPSTYLTLHLLFAVGDVASHVGFVMLIYWDIVSEGIRLAFALDPARKLLGMRMTKVAGVIFVLVEVIFLVPFWILVYDIDRLLPTEDNSPRATLCSFFAVVQYVLVFGTVPSLAFGKLAWGLRKLWKDLPGDIPQHLLYRLRFTQLCLVLLTLLGITDGVCGSQVAFIPFFRNFSGFLYEGVALNSLGALTLLLLGIEVFLTYQQARRRINNPYRLEHGEVRQVIEDGISILGLGTPPEMPPVWERGLSQGLAERFLEIYAGDLCTTEEPATSDICIQLVKPMTARVTRSMWEALSAGFTGGQFSMASPGKYHYLAKPTVMVSHCWSSCYVELMQILKRHDENTDRTNYFFLDVFSMNQHDFADLGSPRDSTSLRDMYDTMLEALTQSIKVPGCMLLALTPHDRPKMLTRSWCLYEIYIAWKVNAEVSCGFIPEAEHSIKRSLTKDDRFLKRLLNRIDAEASCATVKSDRDMILKLIHGAGVQRFNSFVREKLRTSLRVVALTTLNEVETKETNESDILSPGISPRSEASEASEPTPCTRSAFMHGCVSDDRVFHSEGSFSI